MVARMVQAMPFPFAQPALARSGHALADHTQAPDIQAHRRHRGRADDLPARDHGRKQELGLPLRVDSGFGDDALCAAQRRISRGGRSVAAMAAAGGRRPSRATADHVWHHRRPMATGVEVPWLPGYENSVPVRIGNGAMAQRQLDVFGELIDVLHASREADLGPLADRGGWRSRCSRISRNLARAGSRHMGEAWPRTPVHPLADDVLGRVRPGRQILRATRRDPCGHLRPRFRPGTQHVCPNL